MSVSSGEIKAFSCGFADMVEAGQSLVRSLTALAGQQSNQDFRRVIEQINQEVQAGHTLSGAIRKHPDVFSQDYADSIRQGEVNGNLDVMLQQLCSN